MSDAPFGVTRATGNGGSRARMYTTPRIVRPTTAVGVVPPGVATAGVAASAPQPTLDACAASPGAGFGAADSANRNGGHRAGPAGAAAPPPQPLQPAAFAGAAAALLASPIGFRARGVATGGDDYGSFRAGAGSPDSKRRRIRFADSPRDADTAAAGGGGSNNNNNHSNRHCTAAAVPDGAAFAMSLASLSPLVAADARAAAAVAALALDAGGGGGGGAGGVAAAVRRFLGDLAQLRGCAPEPNVGSNNTSDRGARGAACDAFAPARLPTATPAGPPAKTRADATHQTDGVTARHAWTQTRSCVVPALAHAVLAAGAPMAAAGLPVPPPPPPPSPPPSPKVPASSVDAATVTTPRAPPASTSDPAAAELQLLLHMCACDAQLRLMLLSEERRDALSL